MTFRVLNAKERSYKITKLFKMKEKNEEKVCKLRSPTHTSNYNCQFLLSHLHPAHSGPKSQKPGHEGCSLVIRAVNSWFLMKSCI
jgi:hypothetical protein